MTMEDEVSLRVGETFLAGLFFHIDAGSEEHVVQKLKDKGCTNLFKAFGQYDVVAIFNIESFEDDLVYYSFEGIRTVKPLIAYNFATPAYSSPDITPWLSDAPVIGFLFLELDKWFYSEDSGVASSLTAYSVLLEKINEIARNKNIELSLFGGYGRSELYGIVKSNKVEDIWILCLKCRELIADDCFPAVDKEFSKFPVFMNTRSIPCISYNNIKYNKKSVSVTGIEGESSAAISVNCPPGFENYIPAYFSEEYYQCSALLGEEDIVVNTTNNIDTNLLIEKILNFRKKWEQEHRAALSTRTHLQDKFSESTHKPLIYKVNHDNYRLEIPRLLQDKNPRLANRIKNISNTITSYTCNPSYYPLSRSIGNFLHCLEEEINNYCDFIRKNEQIDMHVSESVLMQSAESAERGLAQRIDSGFNALFSSHELPLPFSDGIFGNLLAVEDFINFIFSTWSDFTDSYSGEKIAKGFPTFNDSSGFKATFGEVINLPLVALYDPCDSRGNWLTLTHEISHAIFLRLDIGFDREEELVSIKREWWPMRDSSLIDDEEYIDQVYEIFAHWYDFYHFYNKDIERYILHIWQSWEYLPIFHSSFTDYYFRSLFVYFIQYENKLCELMVDENPDEYTLFCLDLWSNHIDLVNKLTGNVINGEKLETVNEEKTLHIQLFTAYINLMNIFNEYKNEEFREYINKEYDDIESNVSDILDGNMISNKIDNPFLLVKKIILKRLDQKNLQSSTALIMSLKNRSNFFIRTPGSDS